MSLSEIYEVFQTSRHVRRRLLIVSPGVPRKNRGASSILFYHYINWMRQEGFHIRHLPLVRQNDNDDGIDEYCREMLKEGEFEIFPVYENCLIRTNRNIAVDPAAIHVIREKALSFEPEVIVCFDILSAFMAESLSCRCKVVWLGDLSYQVEWYNAWYGAREGFKQFLRLPMKLWRSSVWKGIYHKALLNAEVVIVSSKSSEKQLAKIGIESRYLPYPWPSNTSDGGDNDGSDVLLRDEKPSFLFYGNLIGLGSRSALHFLVDKLYPLMISQWGRDGFHVYIAGMYDLPPWMKEAVSTRPELVYLGYINDIDCIMQACHAVLVPIDVPVGNRSRIVTAMSKGALVIAHRNAALGNPDLIDGETCFLASAPKEFIARMLLSFDSGENNEAIRNCAREVYRNNFEPAVACQMMMDEINHFLNLFEIAQE